MRLRCARVSSWRSRCAAAHSGEFVAVHGGERRTVPRTDYQIWNLRGRRSVNTSRPRARSLRLSDRR